ncbi:mucin-3A-like [Euwallacea similis]|uniref:mucin-3A-like n=1 Tax=Euwallacea similis TaxID=1736056 RepID=UPI00344C34E8
MRFSRQNRIPSPHTKSHRAHTGTPSEHHLTEVSLLQISIVTRQSPFRVGHRKRPSTSVTTVRTTTPSSPRTTKSGRRKPTVRSRSTTFRPPSTTTVESQASIRTSNRFKFVSRKPYGRLTTPKTVTNITDQHLESSNYQSQENKEKNYTDTTELGDLASTLQELQQAPAPTRKRLQPVRTSVKPPLIESLVSSSPTSHDITDKKTLAYSIPFFVSSQLDLYSTPPSFIGNQFRSRNKVPPSTSFLDQIYNLQTITAQDFVNKYTSSGAATTRAGSKYSPATEGPLVVVTSAGRMVESFDKVRNDIKLKTIRDYDYYDNVEASVVGNIPAHSKVLLHANGMIECLDQGNFPHPLSCKKFISCAKMDSDKIIGWEYTCPKNLSFDPIGGMCNWSAGLGCNEN